MTSGMVELNKTKNKNKIKKLTWKVKIASYQFTMYAFFSFVTDQIIVHSSSKCKKKGIHERL